MIAPVVLSFPAALAALAALAAALVAFNRWTDSPVRMIAVTPARRPARHRLAEVTTPYRPHAWTDAAPVQTKTPAWTPDELEAALDAAEQVAAEMAAAERAWAADDTRELVAA